MGIQTREAAREMEHVIRALDVDRGHLAAPGGAANLREVRGKADPLTTACARHPGRRVDRSGDALPTEAVPHVSPVQAALLPRARAMPGPTAREASRRRGGPGGASCKKGVVAVRRIKWLTPAPADDGQFASFGIDCGGAATLYGNRSGGHLVGANSRSESAAEELAETNRAFWTALDRTPEPIRRSLRRRLRGRCRPCNTS